MIISFVVPIAIASFFGSIFSGPADNAEPARIAVAIVDHDGSAVSKAIVAGAEADKNLKLTTPAEAEARDVVKRGKTTRRRRHPAGLRRRRRQRVLRRRREAGARRCCYDPSRSIELAMVRGILTQHVMEAVSREMFGGEQGRKLIEQTLPQLDVVDAMPADRSGR